MIVILQIRSMSNNVYVGRREVKYTNIRGDSIKDFLIIDQRH